jgi:2-polyprenyl-3-methyl-5-hydroxy-6-metoxy-1,4-benzoquinol methylase
VPEKSHILNIGCGKSLFAEDMVLSGKIYDILSCDYSEQVVADMQARSDKKQLPLKYKVADVFDLKYKPD